MNPIGEMPSILLVEDDKVLADITAEYLQNNGYQVAIESNGMLATERILKENPDLVILDVMLPGKDGIDICREVRKAFHNPILMLTARSEEVDQILGLELGADDYICKPVKPRLLQARIKAMLRREEVIAKKLPEEDKAVPRWLTFDELVIDTATRTVTVRDEEVVLATPEYDILYFLSMNAGNIISREQVFKAVRGFEYDGSSRFVDITVSRIRGKMEKEPFLCKRIKTVRGKGYLFMP